MVHHSSSAAALQHNNIILSKLKDENSVMVNKESGHKVKKTEIVKNTEC